MIIFEELTASLHPTPPCVLTIGSFDGVHLGHQRILGRVRELAHETGTSAVLTFSSHPSEVLRPGQSKPLIYPKSLKIEILDELGIDLVYCLEFTRALAELTYDAFLERVHEVFPFDHLVLGAGASLGKGRDGTPEKITELGEKLGFETEYLAKLEMEKGEISSGRIRKAIQQGEMKKAEQFLGRPHMLECEVIEGKLIIPQNLCLPPNGDYPVTLHTNSHVQKAKLIKEGATLRLDFPLSEEKILILFD